MCTENILFQALPNFRAIPVFQAGKLNICGLKKANLKVQLSGETANISKLQLSLSNLKVSLM